MIFSELDKTIPEKYNSWSPRVQQAAQQAWKQLNGNMSDFKVWWKLMGSKRDRAYLASLDLKAQSYYVVSNNFELLNRFRVYWLTQSYMYNYYIGKMVTIRDFIEGKLGTTVEDEEAGRSGGNVFFLYNHKQNHWFGNQGVFHYGEITAFIADRNRKKRLTLLLSEEEITEIKDSNELTRIYLDPSRMDPVQVKNSPTTNNSTTTNTNWES